MNAFEIRAALLPELPVLRAIDEDASALYAEHGIALQLAPEHPFAVDELARWQRSIELGRAFVAVNDEGAALGFATLELADGEPYLDQLAVRVSAMRRGIGGRLLERAAEWARAERARALWLTTYRHLSFNGAFYEQRGYAVVPDAACGPDIRHHLIEQRRFLPAPAERVAMRKTV